MNARLAGISSMATRLILEDAIRIWRQRGGDVAFESVGGAEAAKRVHDGATFDVVVLAAAAIDKLIADGRLLAGSKTDLARSGVAIAVRRGAPRPAIDTDEALRQAVLASRGVGYSTGPSGVALQRIFETWGIVEAVRPRLVQASPGVPVAQLIARGEVTLGFQQLSELTHEEGVDVIGPMPPGLEIVTTFSGAICTSSAQVEVARALLEFLRSPAADEARLRHGMQAA